MWLYKTIWWTAENIWWIQRPRIWNTRFPCNDFGSQEPGKNKEIAEFCSLNFNVTFPMFDKVHVRGNNRSPLFDILTNNSETGTSSIKWNFEKFIIDKNGNVVNRFRSITEPNSKKITSLIKTELSK